MISPGTAAELSPFVDATTVVGAAWSPTDGFARPSVVVNTYAAAAAQLGAEIYTASPVVGIEQAGGDRLAVRTHDGRVYTTPTVICTCGASSKQIGAMVDVDLPIEPLRRQIAFTTPLYPRPPRVPFTIDYNTTAYFHCNDDGSGLLIGIADKTQTVGFDTSVTTDWHDQLRAALAQFAPSLTGVQFASGWAGLYEMTPDCNALIGEPDTSGFRFLYAAGFSGHGFLQGPAVGGWSATSTWAPSPPSTYRPSTHDGSAANTNAPNSTSSDTKPPVTPTRHTPPSGSEQRLCGPCRRQLWPAGPVLGLTKRMMQRCAAAADGTPLTCSVVPQISAST